MCLNKCTNGHNTVNFKDIELHFDAADNPSKQAPLRAS